jgi:hypothetical protein
MTKQKRMPRAQHPSFGQIARILPEVGSREARLLRHILECESCADAALSILKIGNRSPKGKAPNYDSTFAAAAAKATWIFEQGRRAMALAERLFEIPDAEERRRQTQELARVDPWAVTESLLDAANLLLETDPNRAGELAELAAVAAEEMNPEGHPGASRMRLLAQARFLLGESLNRLQEVAEEALGQAEKQFEEVTGIEPLRHSRSLRRRQRS